MSSSASRSATLEWCESRRDARRRRHDGARALRDPRACARSCTTASSSSRRCPRRSTQLHQHSRWASSSRCTPSTTTPFWREQGSVGHRLQPLRARARGLRQHQPRRRARHARRIRLATSSADDAARAVGRGAQGARSSSRSSHYYGPEAKNPVVYYESDWGERGVDARRLRGELRHGRAHPVRRGSAHAGGPIHFACSDMAGAGYQHVDGAIRMGRLVAANILEETRT